MLLIDRMTFTKICGKYGVTIEDSVGCIKDMQRGLWLIDEDHPSYPLNRFGSSSSNDVDVEDILLSGGQENIEVFQRNFIANKYGENSEQYNNIKHGVSESQIEMPAYPDGSAEDIKAHQKIKQPHDLGEGVGTELKLLLSMIGIKSTANCSCIKRAKMMNMKGLAWCKQNKEVILGWMKEEAEARGLPFIAFAAKKVLNFAINKTERKEKEND